MMVGEWNPLKRFIYIIGVATKNCDIGIRSRFLNSPKINYAFVKTLDRGVLQSTPTCVYTVDLITGLKVYYMPTESRLFSNHCSKLAIVEKVNKTSVNSSSLLNR